MKKQYLIIAMLLQGVFYSCNDFLDREPLSNITPEVYFKNEKDLESYTISRYNFPVHGGYNIGTFGVDNGTDNQAASGASNLWKPGEWKVGADGGAWNFGQIRQLNYFLDVAPKNLSEGLIQGNAQNINHYIGEAYFLRAYEYFNKLKTFGDFPIIETVLPDDKATLVEASKRQPRNKVARFILSDLDKAISLLLPSPVANKNRISREVALLFKSRVALYEGTWLKHHQGTAFVPGGPGWPGAQFHPNFTIDIPAETQFFFTEAMNAAKQVADAIPLVKSSHSLAEEAGLNNPYFKMFSDTDMSGYSEVLLWRAYSTEFGSRHFTQHYFIDGGNSGYTKSFVESFLMKNGLPIYDSAAGYQGDETLAKVRAERDERLQLFMSIPEDLLYYEGTPQKLYYQRPPDNVLYEIITKKLEEKYPKDVAAQNNPTNRSEETKKYLSSILPKILQINERKSVTGYAVKKGVNGSLGAYVTSEGNSPNGCIVFRATEAYLNYIEAAYEKNNALDADATEYWKKLRKRAGLPEDPQVTIAATDLSKENDWAKYSKGVVVDATLYNIRRERRCEFIAEGMRMDDLKRWRALDQVRNAQIEGFNLWTQIYQEREYLKEDGTSKLKALPQEGPNVSAKTVSNYLRPYQIIKDNNLFYDGYSWTPAHYLSPIAFSHFLETSPGTDATKSVIYQNPDWPIQANGSPTVR